MMGYLPLIQKDSVTHMPGLAVYIYVFEWLYTIQFFISFSSVDHLLRLLCTDFVVILSNIEDVLSFNPGTTVFVFGDFSAHHQDWLTYSGGTNRQDELCHNFSISNDLNFPTQITDCNSHNPTFWTYFFILMLVFVIHWLSLH